MSSTIDIFAWIDMGIHNFIIEIFDLIFRIAEVNIFHDGVIEPFTERVYGILGIIILFKIIISAIQYLISPDKILDKDKGIGGLLQRTIISVALLALVPTIFGFAKTIQNFAVEAIPQIIFGNKIDTVSDDGTSDTRAVATNLSLMTLKAFIRDDKGNIVELGNTIEDYLHSSVITKGCGFIDYSKCTYNYNFLFSILVGGFLVYIFLSMGIDIGIRTIKMGIIEILAPIPISSYINSEENFKAWYKMAFKVYLDLFIRLIVIYFITFVINLLTNPGNENSVIEFTNDTYLFIYIVIALLMFAKSAPKFICEALGIRSDGFGDMAEMFKPVWQRGGVAALGGIGTAGIANFANRVKSGWGTAAMQWQKGGIGNKLKAAGMLGASLGSGALSGIAGATSAGIHGGIAAIKGKSGKEVMAAGHKRAITARQNRDIDRINGVSALDRWRVRTNDFLGIDTDASLAEGRQRAYSTLHTDVGNFKKAVMGRITKTANVAMVEGAGSASDALGKLLASNMGAIMASGNNDLIAYTQRFDIKQDAAGNWVYNGLKAGSHISYHDLAAITADATQCGIGSIASLTGENGALTLQAQKELFAASMRGTIVDTTGTAIDELNVGNDRTHVDIKTAVGTAEEHLAQNALSLGEITYKSSTGVKRPVSGASGLIGAFEDNFGSLDDAVQTLSAQLSTSMSKDKDAAARASIQRRDSNNKSGS